MNKQTVELINNLSEIYSNIRKRVTDTGEILESDILFIKFYDKFIDDIFDFDKRRKIVNE